MVKRLFEILILDSLFLFSKQLHVSLIKTYYEVKLDKLLNLVRSD